MIAYSAYKSYKNHSDKKHAKEHEQAAMAHGEPAHGQAQYVDPPNTHREYPQQHGAQQQVQDPNAALNAEERREL